jgi:ankyrin repeat protein
VEGTTADRFVDLACLTHVGTDAIDRREEAVSILRVSPALAANSVHAAAVIGDVAALRGLLDARPALATERGGPRGWAPLLYLGHGRVTAPDGDPCAAARLLLERGADPDTHAIITDCRYTAITGAIGIGEAGPVAAPPHPQARALVELLLDAGADANDSQALYNTHFLRDDSWLELFLSRGLDADDEINWTIDSSTRVPMLEYLLGAAARQGFQDRVALLLAHGASPNGRDLYTRRVHLENALLNGHGAVAGILLRHGATAPSFSSGEALRVACLRGDEAEVRRLAGAGLDGRDDLATLLAAARHGNLRAVRLCLDVLGVDVNATDDKNLTALHLAAGDGHRLVVEELLARGASLLVKDAVYGGTPLGRARWAARTWPTPERADVARLLAASEARVR